LAKDKGTGKEQHITITNSSGLSKEEVENLVKQAKQHEAEDKKQKDVIEKRNSLDNMILSIEKTIRENKEKLPADEVQKVETALEEAKKILKENENDAEALQKATNDLLTASHKIAEILYKEQQNNSSQNSQNDSNDQNNTDNNNNNSNSGNNGPIDI
jgi:molecular chaperone DnaK